MDYVTRETLHPFCLKLTSKSGTLSPHILVMKMHNLKGVETKLFLGGAEQALHRISVNISGWKTLLPGESAITFNRQPLDKTHFTLHSV